MTEQLSFPDQEANLTSKEQVEDLRQRMLSIWGSLIVWIQHVNEDSIASQRHRAADFYRISKQLENAVDDTRLLNGFKLQLITGSSPVTSYIFTKGPYDFYHPEYKELEPQSVLNVDFSHHWKISDSLFGDYPKPEEFYQNDSMLFIGEWWNRILPITTVAKTFEEGGKFEIVEAASTS